MAALVGRGVRVRPGEVGFAHFGVLFLDELPEFQRAALDSLRQPLKNAGLQLERRSGDSWDAPLFYHRPCAIHR
jgi:magnesium chelatase family protein